MRTRGFDSLWRWRVTDEIELPDGSKITVTAKRLTKQLKSDREDYAFAASRAMRDTLLDENSAEYNKFLRPQDTLSKDDLLKVIEFRERVQLVARAQREFPSQSPSETDDEVIETILDRLEAEDQEAETASQISDERVTWVEEQLTANMASYKDMERDELVVLAKRGITENLINGAWWEAYNDASLKLGIFVGDKPLFKDWPTDADDDFKARLLELYQDADAASFDFSS